MPDGDVIPSAPVRLWKRPYDLICSGAQAETVADGIYHSLLISIRNKGGLPGAQDMDTLSGKIRSRARGLGGSRR